MPQARTPSGPSSTGLLLLLLAVFGLLVLAVVLSRLDLSPDTSLPERLHFTPVDYSDLPGFGADPVRAALPALQKSCAALSRMPATRLLTGPGVGGRAGDWATACEAVLDLDPEAASHGAVRAVLRQHFTPYAVSLGGKTEGLFTGYFEPVLKGSLTQSARYSVPLYGRPSDLVMVELGAFRADLKGRRVAGRVVGGRLQPFDDRAAISAGALAGQGLELVWVDDPVDAFVLHIQGSGRIELDDGRRVRVAYAAQNGHAYVAIGRVLRDMGALAPDGISMPAIRKWLAENPDEAEAVMNQNRSFVFFSLEDDRSDGPSGSAGVPLTAERSLAVDRTKLPLHAPVYLVTTRPNVEAPAEPPVPFQRLMVAQDTGGAIRGEIRGDVFWGMGDRARAIAGRMANRGRYFVLLPKTLGPAAGTDRAR